MHVYVINGHKVKLCTYITMSVTKGHKVCVCVCVCDTLDYCK